MLKLFPVIIILFLFQSCRNIAENNFQKISIGDSIRIIQQYVENEKRLTEKYKQQGDSIKRYSLKLVGIEDIRNIDHEAYLFWWGKVPFAQPDYIYLFERLPNNQYKLTTKCVFWNPDTIELKIRWKNKIVEVDRDKLLDSSSQILSEKEWDQFKKILGGSYYWAFDDPCPHGDGVLDGESWGLESMSKFCCCDTGLKYRRTSIHSPKEGSFRNACLYLIHKSDMTKGIKIN